MTRIRSVLRCLASLLFPAAFAVADNRTEPDDRY